MVIAGGDDIQQAVVVEIIDDSSAGHGEFVEPGRRSYVYKAAYRFFRLKNAGRD